MFRILGYGFLFFVAQIVFLILWVWLNIALHPTKLPFESLILYLYLWPLMIVSPTGTGSHGGELFFAPVAAIIYSLIFGIVVNAWRNSKSR